MNFTEICELNDILTHSRSFRSHVPFSLPQKHEMLYHPHELNFVSVDELIFSSYKDHSPMRGVPFINSLNLKDDDEEDNIEKLIADISKTIFPIATNRSEIRRRSKELNKPLMLICSSPSLKDIKTNNLAPPPLLRLKRAVTLEVQEDEQIQEPSPKHKTSIYDESEDKSEDKNEEIKETSISELNIKSKIKEDDDDLKQSEVENENINANTNTNTKPVERAKENRKRKVNFTKMTMFASSRQPAEFKGRAPTRKNTITILEDCNRKFFKKLHEEEFKEYFMEKTNKRSSLSESLMNKFGSQTSFLVQAKNFNLNYKDITVFFFATSTKLKIPININCTVNELIRAIIAGYMKSDKVDHSLMKYPNQPEAYELRCLEDDDDYKPEMSFDPLARDRNFIEYNIDSLAFCEISNFSAESNKERTSSYIYNQVFYKEKQMKMDEILAKKKKNVIEVNITEENYSTMIPIGFESTIRDIFPILQRRIKINPSKYVVRALHSDENEFDQFDSDEIDINMPFKSLKTSKLQFVRKIFADDPETNFSEINKPEINYCYESDSYDDLNQFRIGLNCIEMNDTQAALYEEFEVIKIKCNGTREVRILGINKFSIFNKYKEKQESGFLSFFNIFAVSKKTKYPERLIESIQDVDFILETDNQFFIDFLEPNNKLKRLVFEAPKKTAIYILTKLRYLTYFLTKEKNFKNYFRRKKIKRRKRARIDEN